MVVAVKLHPLLDAAVAADYAQTLAHRGGFEIVYDPTVGTAYTMVESTKGGRAVIVVPPWDATQCRDALNFTLYMIIHEVAHHEHGAHLFEIQEREKLDVESLLAYVFNVVEDVRIENAGAAKYKGDARTMCNGMLSFLKWKYPQTPAKPCEDDVTRTMAGLTNTAICARTFIDKRHIIEVESITRKKKCQDEWLRLTDRWRKPMLGLPHGNVDGTEASWQLAKDIVKEEFPPEFSEKKNYQQQKVKAKGKKGDGEGDEEGDGDGDGSGKQAKGKGKKGHGTGQVIVSDHAEQGALSDASTDPGTGDKFVNSGAGTYTFDPTAIHMPQVGKRDGADATSSQARKYANRLRTLIQAETYPQWVRGLDKGRRLANNRLYRVGLPDHDPDHKKIWQRKIEKDNPALDTAVSIIVDMSQSMGETMKCGACMMTVACDIAGALDHALRDILHIQVEVLGFTANTPGVVISEISTFGGRVRRGQVAATLRSEYKRNRGTTPTGMAMLVAMKRLLAHGARRKIVLVITDGAPYSGVYSHAMVGDSKAQAVDAHKATVLMDGFDMFGLCLQSEHNNPRMRKEWKDVFGQQHAVVTTHKTAVAETFRGLIKLLMRR